MARANRDRAQGASLGGAGEDGFHASACRLIYERPGYDRSCSRLPQGVAQGTRLGNEDADLLH
jgi:hypothetical protein